MKYGPDIVEHAASPLCAERHVDAIFQAGGHYTARPGCKGVSACRSICPQGLCAPASTRSALRVSVPPLPLALLSGHLCLQFDPSFPPLSMSLFYGFIILPALSRALYLPPLSPRLPPQMPEVQLLGFVRRDCVVPWTARDRAMLLVAKAGCAGEAAALASLSKAMEAKDMAGIARHVRLGEGVAEHVRIVAVLPHPEEQTVLVLVPQVRVACTRKALGETPSSVVEQAPLRAVPRRLEPAPAARAAVPRVHVSRRGRGRSGIARAAWRDQPAAHDTLVAARWPACLRTVEPSAADLAASRCSRKTTGRSTSWASTRSRKSIDQRGRTWRRPDPSSPL